MGQLTSRGALTKSDASDVADVAVHNANVDQIHDEVMQIPFVTSTPAVADSWPGKVVIRDSGDPLLYLPDVRVNKADSFWQTANSGSWESYTPEITGITVGNGTLLGRFVYQGTVLYMEIFLVWGSTTSFSGSIGFGTPSGFKLRVPPDDGVMKAGVGYWMARVAGLLWKGRVIRRVTSVGIDLEPRTHAEPALTVNATRPGTWVNGDKLFIQVMAECER